MMDWLIGRLEYGCRWAACWSYSNSVKFYGYSSRLDDYRRLRAASAASGQVAGGKGGEGTESGATPA